MLAGYGYPSEKRRRQGQGRQVGVPLYSGMYSRHNGMRPLATIYRSIDMAYLGNKSKKQLEAIIRHNQSLMKAKGVNKTLMANLKAETQEAQNQLALMKQIKDENS